MLVRVFHFSWNNSDYFYELVNTKWIQEKIIISWKISELWWNCVACPNFGICIMQCDLCSSGCSDSQLVSFRFLTSIVSHAKCLSYFTENEVRVQCWFFFWTWWRVSVWPLDWLGAVRKWHLLKSHLPCCYS